MSEWRIYSASYIPKEKKFVVRAESILSKEEWLEKKHLMRERKPAEQRIIDKINEGSL